MGTIPSIPHTAYSSKSQHGWGTVMYPSGVSFHFLSNPARSAFSSHIIDKETEALGGKVTQSAAVVSVL